MKLYSNANQSSMNEFFTLQSPSIFLKSDSPLSEDLSRFATLSYLNENETVLVANTHQENVYFIIQGYIRSYFKHVDGSETTCWYFGKGDMAFSDNSILYNERSTITLQATCPTRAFRLTVNDFDKLRESSPEFNRICLNLIGAFHSRLFEYAHILLRLPREARFEMFLHKNPRILGQVKEKDLANFLHMHPNSLSGLKRDTMLKSK